MGWKNVKDHYRIGHIVQVREGRIAIGSGYVHDLIRVGFDGAVSWGNLGPAANEDLQRYYAEMTADPATLRRLVAEPDTFAAALTVYTYSGGEILEKQCEEYGWPNVCHDGQLQYYSSHSPDRDQVLRWAVANTEARIEYLKRTIAEETARLAKLQAYMDQARADLAKLKKEE